MPGTTETELTYRTKYSGSVTVLSDDLTKEKKDGCFSQSTYVILHKGTTIYI